MNSSDKHIPAEPPVAAPQATAETPSVELLTAQVVFAKAREQTAYRYMRKYRSENATLRQQLADAQRELEQARETTDRVLQRVQDWCDAVASDASWDSWDDHYKSFQYGGFYGLSVYDIRALLATRPTATKTAQESKP